ncbi:aldo/keto reductase [Kineococcus radiotolerans]|uniref:Pyridoxal 4-dehydrogenase n=1 Tax=Kineococcus radiotolerans (strain ATCC BAA-149 / DSM 14245 / SRS30216) TaxID=266940 RepID=A6WFR9_KINRD|nr:aldo/keto reductase [Kineococcus radiotolerans]ABS05658.1 Pyridoxal 4-dehydrogenase [Kineococcus radiotolerans SRS30216 = ATCC BAA-149]
MTAAAPDLPTRPLGGSGLRVPVLGFGGAGVGNLYAAVPDDVAAATVRAALDAGVHYVDTAPHYGLGLSEERLGAVLRTRPRESFVLSTKVGRLLVPQPPPHGRDGIFDVPAHRRRVWDFTAAGVRRSLEESLERLGLDAVDVLLVHDADDHEDEARAGAFPELLRMREEGLVRAVGAGMNATAPLTRFVREFPLDVVLVAGRYDLLDQSALDDLLPAAAQRGTSVVLGGVFGSGVLAVDRPGDDATYRYRPAPADVLARARRLADIAREHGTTLPALALQAVLAHPVVAAAVVGVRSPQEVARNVGLLGADVPAEVWAAVRAEGLVDPRTPLPELPPEPGGADRR